MELFIKSTIGALGTALSFLFGGWNEAFTFLFILTIADYVTGMIASVIEGTGLSSRIGYKGLLKKTGMWLAILVLYHADKFLGLDGNLSLMTGAIYFFMANEAISITENYGRMKLPMPSQLKSLIAVLKEKGEQR